MFFFKNDLNEKIQNWKLHKEDFDLNLVIKYFRQIADAKVSGSGPVMVSAGGSFWIPGACTMESLKKIWHWE